MSRKLSFILAALLALTLALPAGAQKKVCLYNARSSFTTSLQTLLGSGYNVVNYDQTAWGGLTLGQFQSCAGIFVPDTDQTVPSHSASAYTALNNNKLTWSMAVTGNVVLSGAHMGGHGFNASGQIIDGVGGPGRVVKGMIDFITSTPGNAGFLSATDWGLTSYSHGSVFQVAGSSSYFCHDDVVILVNSLPPFLAKVAQPVSQGGYGVMQNDLANMGCSAHNIFPSRPAQVWLTFAEDHESPIPNTSPVRYEANIIVRQAASASGQMGGMGGFLVVTQNGGQFITQTGTVTFTFNINNIKGGTGIAISNNVPGMRILQICAKGKGWGMVKHSGGLSSGKNVCPIT